MPGPALAYGPDHYTPAAAAQYVQYTFIGNYILYATACLLVYELVTSLDDEVARVWSLKWRLPKILFMLNRYVIRAMLVVLWIVADYPGTSAEFCRVYGYWQMIPLRLAILAAQALVVIRVWAIYNNSRPMFWVLCTLYTLEVLAVALCVLIATRDTQGVAQPAPLSCALVSRSGYLLKRAASGTWIAPLCFEFIMVLITLAKLVPRWSWRSPRRQAGLWGSGGNATLDVLARDSLIYFVLIFTFTLTNAIIYELNFSAYYHSLLLGPTSAISCIAVSRMVINMRSLPTLGSLTQSVQTGTAYADADLRFNDDYTFDGPNREAVPDTARPFLGAHAKSRSTRKIRGPPRARARAAPADAHATSVPPSATTLLAGPAVLLPSEGSRPGSARTSGDETCVGSVEDDVVLGKLG
ncbi:hypothetical protein GGX14DRAFT_454254 [Mycena pura]|uniref:DUF6533 domain-containing protein n=1 Tax=Mycena pura TaxID=153505 RepID=A0AAD6VBH6_9AGAR|nr:hypothetical protein GGX14DRAFT_454254 [Mycena pura]